MALIIVQKDYTWISRLKVREPEDLSCPVDDLGEVVRFEDHAIELSDGTIVFPMTIESFGLAPIKPLKDDVKFSVWTEAGLAVTDSTMIKRGASTNLSRLETNGAFNTTFHSIPTKATYVLSPWKEYSRMVQTALMFEPDVMKVLETFWQVTGHSVHLSPIKIPTQVLRTHTPRNRNVQRWFKDPHNYTYDSKKDVQERIETMDKLGIKYDG